MPAPRPYNLVAELTYRCPLRCVYCSNPVDYAGVPDALSAEAAHETRVKRANRVDPGLRLACRAEIHGPVEVTAAYW